MWHAVTLHCYGAAECQITQQCLQISLRWSGLPSMLNWLRSVRTSDRKDSATSRNLRSMLLHFPVGLAATALRLVPPRHPCVARLVREQTRWANPTCCMSSSSVRNTSINKVQKPDELVTLVDQHNNVIGHGTRGEMRAQNAIHRCSFVAIFNGQGKLYVQKRVSFKETYPSHYDPAPGGVVGADESYEESATREISEEMGVNNVTLQTCFDFYHEDELTRLWGRLFTCIYDGEFKLDPEEVESGQFMTVQDVKDLLASGPVPPDSKACLDKYFAERE